RGAAAGHEVGPANLGNLGQVGLLHPRAFYDLRDIETAPAKVGDVELPHAPVFGWAIGLVADEPGSVGQFEDEAQFAEAGLFRAPADPGLAREIDQRGFRAQA